MIRHLWCSSVLPVTLALLVTFADGELVVPGCPSVESTQQQILNSTQAGEEVDQSLYNLCFCHPAENDASAVRIHCLYGSPLADFNKSLKAVSDSGIPLKSVVLEDLNFYDNVETPGAEEGIPVLPNGFFTEFKAKPEQFMLSSCPEALLIEDNAFDGLEDILKSLIIIDCNVGGIPPAVRQMRSLEVLNISESGVEMLLNGDLKGLENLKHLNLAGNEMSVLDPEAMANLTKLESLAIGSGNYLNSSAIFEAVNKIPSLKVLDLQNTHLLKDLPPNGMENLKSLKILSLYNNQLNNISNEAFVGLDALEELEIGYLLLEKLDDGTFAPLKNLKTLRLRGNFIVEISKGTFDGLSNLTHLDLENNELQKISPNTFSPLASLEHLNLAENKNLTVLSSGAFNGLTQLKELYLNKTALHHIASSTFQPLTNLQTLDLSQTNIRSIHPNAFKFSSALQSLRLSNLTLRTLPAETVQVPSLTDLDLSLTKWLCDDQLKGLVRHIQSASETAGTTFHLQNQGNTTCDRPLKLRGEKLGGLDVNKLLPYDPSVDTTTTTTTTTVAPEPEPTAEVSPQGEPKPTGEQQKPPKPTKPQRDYDYKDGVTEESEDKKSGGSTVIVVVVVVAFAIVITVIVLAAVVATLRKQKRENAAEAANGGPDSPSKRTVEGDLIKNGQLNGHSRIATAGNTNGAYEMNEKP